MPLLWATSFSRPVDTSGGSVTSNGTACRCMFDPISAAVGVVMFEERNQAGRDAHHLLRRNVDDTGRCPQPIERKSPPKRAMTLSCEILWFSIGVSAGARLACASSSARSHCTSSRQLLRCPTLR